MYRLKVNKEVKIESFEECIDGSWQMIASIHKVGDEYIYVDVFGIRVRHEQYFYVKDILRREMSWTGFFV